MPLLSKFILCACASAPLIADSIDRVDWSNDQAESVMKQLAQRMNRVLRVDNRVAEQIRSTRITLHTRHLSAENAMRWAARLAGAECFMDAQRVTISPPDSPPDDWRPPVESDDETMQRRGDLSLVDATFSMWRKAMEAAYHIDVMADEAAAATQNLVSVEGRNLSMTDALAASSKQIGADLRVLDGMVVVSSNSSVAVTRTDLKNVSKIPARAPMMSAPKTSPAPLTISPLKINSSSLTWKRLGELARAAGCALVIPVSMSAKPIERVEADGPADRVVEALLLSENCSFTRSNWGGGFRYDISAGPGRAGQ